MGNGARQKTQISTDKSATRCAYGTLFIIKTHMEKRGHAFDLIIFFVHLFCFKNYLIVLSAGEGEYDSFTVLHLERKYHEIIKCLINCLTL